MSLEHVVWRVVGLSPVIMDNYAAGLGRRGIMPRPSDAPDPYDKHLLPTEREVVEEGAYRMPNGQLCIPARSFRRALLTESEGKRIGELSATKVLVESVFLIPDGAGTEFVALEDPETRKPLYDYEVHSMMVWEGNRESSTIRAMPFIRKWSGLLHLNADVKRVDVTLVTDLLRAAGSRTGVLHLRPHPSIPGMMGGPYGRFSIEIATLEERAGHQ